LSYNFFLIDSFQCRFFYTNEGANASREMHHAGSGEVVELLLAQPSVGAPAPVGLHGVQETGDQAGKDDVAVEIGALGDSAGHDGGAGGRECALKKSFYVIKQFSEYQKFFLYLKEHERQFAHGQIRGEELLQSNDRAPLSEGEGIAANPKCHKSYCEKNILTEV
jgi:hypothetical protein